MSLVFDIETIPYDVNHPAAQAAIAHAAEKAKLKGEDEVAARAAATERLGLSPFTGRVAVFACWDTEKGSGAAFAEAGGEERDLGSGFKLFPVFNEEELVTTAWRVINARSQVVSWNGLFFDQPFLVARALHYGVKVPVWLLNAKPWEDAHVDLCARTSMDRYRTTLEVAALSLGIASPKGKMKGSEVAAAWAAGRREEVARYCCDDVDALRWIWASWRTSTVDKEAE